MKTIWIFCVGLFLLSRNDTLHAQEKYRRAIRGFSYEVTNGNVIVKSINEESKKVSDLRVDDIIKSIDGQQLVDYQTAVSVLSQLPANKIIDVDIIRGDKPLALKIELKPVPFEVHDKTNVEYGWLMHQGDQLRKMITVPKAATLEKYPAILLVQWLSCGTVEIPGDPADGMDYVIKSFANNPNYIFYRIDKSGVGDSRGTPCNEMSARKEIAAYRMALDDLKNRNDVDTTHIYILGLSLGASLAPVVGEKQGIAGYLVSGGTTKTWFEHMLEFERNRLTLSGVPNAEVNEKMRAFTEFYYCYLFKKMTPEQIIQQFPEYRDIWYDDPRHQFGRSVEFYQQLQELDFQNVWSKVRVPALVLYGEYDWVMSLEDHQSIAEWVNGNGQFTLLPKTSHLLTIHPTLLDAFEENEGEINKDAYDIMVNWLSNKIR